MARNGKMGDEMTTYGDDEWAFAIWQASTDSYTDAILLDGSFTGHPNLALDTACTLYLADTGDRTP